LACIEQSAQRHSRHDAKPAKHFGFVVCVLVAQYMSIHAYVFWHAWRDRKIEKRHISEPPFHMYK
jgi:hypothetical protein